MNSREPREVILTVAEVEDVLVSLKSAKIIRHLEGEERRQFQEAHDALVGILDHSTNGTVVLSTTVVVGILRCALSTQAWLSETITELLLEKTND